MGEQKQGVIKRLWGGIRDWIHSGQDALAYAFEPEERMFGVCPTCGRVETTDRSDIRFDQIWAVISKASEELSEQDWTDLVDELREELSYVRERPELDKPVEPILPIN